ncbi:MAG: hypothetical protein BYD32DRAFT_179794 [Podila humilis]|nr:MAG: hypothetical protein BYD32DRAFT_179794 [Podila humilis]
MRTFTVQCLVSYGALSLCRQEGQVTVACVKGHTGNKGNEATDGTAKSGHQHVVWDIDPAEHTDLHTHAGCQGIFVKDDLRQVPNKQTAGRKHHYWTTQNQERNTI